jgi:hypothetical protein
MFGAIGNDLAEIQTLLARYNICGDRGDIVGLAATFSTDGVLEFSGSVMKGREAIIDRLSSDDYRTPELTYSRHHLTTSLVDITGDTAEARTYFQVFTEIGLDHHGVYVDRLDKVAGEWLIVHRQDRIDWQSPQSLFAPMWVRGNPPM